MAHTFGRFEVIDLLGKGGMGEVYRAQDTVSGEVVALKTLGKRGLERGGLLAFKREYHTLASLQHPNIIKAFDFGMAGEQPFYTMEYLEGADLSSLSDMSLTDICSSLRDVASALAYLHARRFIHRDVTMRNVRIDNAGRATLLDFGILASVGATCHVAGTPPFVPPEALQGLPLDHRVDLYALGALAYRALVGQHAYPAPDFHDLPALWRKGPRPLTELRPDIPVALDRLIVGLLAPKRLARPESATEVIDALSSIGKLPPLPESEVSRAHLSNAALVGRRREMRALENLLESARRGRGNSVLLEATSGMGKSRLLAETGLAARLSGFEVIQVDCAHAHSSYGVVRAIAKAALRAMPDLARSAAEPHRAALARVVPELVGDCAYTARGSESSLDDRIEIHQALKQWLRTLLQHKAVVLAIDDVQRADEASASFLAGVALMAREHNLLVIAGLRRGEEIRAAEPIQSIRKCSKSMLLRGLDVDEVKALVRATLGPQVESPSFSTWMHRASDGNPMRIAALSQQLVKDGILEFLHGEWSVSGDLERAQVPSSLAEALDATISQLDEDVRELGQILAVLGQAWSLGDIAELSEFAAERTLNAMETLIAQDVVIQTASLDGPAVGAGHQEETDAPNLRFKLRHDGLREALLRSVSGQELQRLHHRAAVFLQAHPEPSSARVAWHLLRAGDQIRAAEMLEEVGVALFEMHSMRDAIAPMEAALLVFEAHKMDRSRCMELRRRIITAGMFCDRDVVTRHLDSSLELAWRQAGMHVARVAGKLFGRTLGFLLGLVWGALSRRLRNKQQRGPVPLKAVSDLVTYFIGTMLMNMHTFQFGRVDSTLQRMRVLSIFEGRIPMGTYRMCQGIGLAAEGRVQSMIEHSAYAHRVLTEDDKTPMAPANRTIAMAVAKSLECFAMIQRCDPRMTEAGFEIEANPSGLPNFTVVLRSQRAMVLRAQGYEKHCLQLLGELEERRIQIGSTWVVEASVQWQSSIAYAMTGDRMGLRRSIREMKQLDQEGIHCVYHLALAKTEYRLLQHNIEGARTALDQAKGCTVPMLAQPLLAIEAEILLAEGALEEAFSVARKGMAAARDSDRGLPVYQARYVSVLAQSMVRAEALALIEDTLAELASYQNPAASGRLCECGALIALQAGDLEQFEHYIDTAESLYAPTENPVLLRRLEQLRVQRRSEAFATFDDTDLDEPTPPPGLAVDPDSSPSADTTRNLQLDGPSDDDRDKSSALKRTASIG